MAGRKQGSLFQLDAKADETRVRLEGSVRVPADAIDNLDFGDTVEIRIVAHVKRGTIERHDSGLTVREFVVKQDKAEITVLGAE